MPASKDVKNGVVSSGPSAEGIEIDEKKRRRMESNRESARRSRQKKQQHLDDLIKQVGGLTRENAEIDKKIKEVSKILATYEAQNKVLKCEKDRLAAKLDSLNSIININKVFNRSISSSSTNDNYNGAEQCMPLPSSFEVNNNNNNGYGDPMMMMKPWQLPCPSMPLIPSSGLHSSSSSSYFNFNF